MLAGDCANASVQCWSGKSLYNSVWTIGATPLSPFSGSVYGTCEPATACPTGCRPSTPCGGLQAASRTPPQTSTSPGLALGEDLLSTPVQGAKRVVAEAKARERPRMVSRWAHSHEAGASLRRSPHVAVSVTPGLGGCAAEGGGVGRVRITPSALPALEILGQVHRSAVKKILGECLERPVGGNRIRRRYTHGKPRIQGLRSAWSIGHRCVPSG